MRHRACVFAIAALAVVAGVTSGCTRQPPRLASSWPEASAEATIAAPLGAATWPLTGAARPANARASRVALATFFAPGAVSRQLAGVGAADVVYEWAGSGSQTQVAALLQSTVPAVAGPVGVSNPVAQAIARQYRAAPCYVTSSGLPPAPSAPGETKAMTPVSFPSAFGKGTAGLLGGTYLRAQKAYAAIPPAAAAGQQPGRLFFSASVDATQPTTAVTVPLSAKAGVRWSYRAKPRSYERDVSGRLQRDASSNKAIAVQNLVVMWVRPAEAGAGAASGDLTPVGSGQVSVFRDGVRLDGHWRASVDSPPRFTAEDGAPILFAPGVTWFEIIPLTANIAIK